MEETSAKLVWLARLGYVARGVVYALLGYLALSSTGADEVAHGQAGAMEYIRATRGGSFVLFAAALGLLGYALFRVSTALLDTEKHGHDAKGMATRIGHGCSALVHFGLAWTALQLAIGMRQDAGDRTHDAVRTALSFELGDIVVGIVGLGLIAAAAFQAKDAWTLGFMKRVSGRAPSWICWLGRFGYAARALVFALMGWSLLRSAWFERTEEALSLGRTITDLRDMGHLYALVAVGLILFGMFSVIVARYRIIPEMDAAPALKALRRKVA